MKTKITLLLIALLCCLSCKTTQKKTSEKVEIKTEQTVQEQVSAKSIIETTAAGTAETNLQKNERENSYYILFFPPDSTGKQYPQVIGGTEKTSDLAIAAREDWDFAVKSQFDYLYDKIDQLEQQINEQSKIETKTGLTFLEKIGLVSLAIIVLYSIFRGFKWYLKIKK